jgi:hypothetical protein
MSSSAYWQQATPDKPLGSCQLLKRLIWNEQPPYGEKTIVKDGGHLSVYLKGYIDGLPSNHNSREDLAQFLEDLRAHGELEVWVDG